jgi:membrane protein
MSTTLERRRIARESRDPPPSGWWDFARRVKDDVAADNVSMIAAGAAFFGLLALFPAGCRCPTSSRLPCAGCDGR